MVLKILRVNLILCGIYAINIQAELTAKNQIITNLKENNEKILPLNIIESSTSILTLSELFPNLYPKLERSKKNAVNPEISNTLHSLYSEERDLCIGYDSIRGNRVKRQKCPENCTCENLHSINIVGENSRRIKRHDINHEIDSVKRIKRNSSFTSDTLEGLESNIEVNYDLKYPEKNKKSDREIPTDKVQPDSEIGLNLENLETINYPQIEKNPLLNFRKDKCLENCINLNDIEFDDKNGLILKSENLEKINKTDETRRKREEDCKNCIIRSLLNISKNLNKNKTHLRKRKCPRKKHSNKKSVKNKYARRKTKYEKILRKFKPKTRKHNKKRAVDLYYTTFT